MNIDAGGSPEAPRCRTRTSSGGHAHPCSRDWYAARRTPGFALARHRFQEQTPLRPAFSQPPARRTPCERAENSQWETEHYASSIRDRSAPATSRPAARNKAEGWAGMGGTRPGLLQYLWQISEFRQPL